MTGRMLRDHHRPVTSWHLVDHSHGVDLRERNEQPRVQLGPTDRGCQYLCRTEALLPDRSTVRLRSVPQLVKRARRPAAVPAVLPNLTSVARGPHTPKPRRATAATRRVRATRAKRIAKRLRCSGDLAVQRGPET